jgi:hypothetical protein
MRRNGPPRDGAVPRMWKEQREPGEGRPRNTTDRFLSGPQHDTSRPRSLQFDHSPLPSLRHPGRYSNAAVPRLRRPAERGRCHACRFRRTGQRGARHDCTRQHSAGQRNAAGERTAVGAESSSPGARSSARASRSVGFAGGRNDRQRAGSARWPGARHGGASARGREALQRATPSSCGSQRRAAC